MTKSPPRIAIILAAGDSTRMQTSLPKPLHAIAGKPMLEWVMAAVAGVRVGRIFCVTSPKLQSYMADMTGSGGLGNIGNLDSMEMVVQSPPAGTGDGVAKCLPFFKKNEADSTVLIVYADTPLISADTLAGLAGLVEGGKHGIACLGFNTDTPSGYGRIIQNEKSEVTAIIEEKDADAKTRAIRLVNGGVMAAKQSVLADLVPKLGDDNAAGEKYLTDIVALASKQGIAVGCLVSQAEEVLGVNSRGDLARVEAVAQNRLRQQAMQNGVTLLAPDTVFLAADSVIEADVIIHPHVVIGSGVRIGQGAEIKAFTHIEGADIGEDASIGPYARLRPGTQLAAETRIGNFVETKNIRMGKGSKASHLAYLGDGEIGTEVNIGAGAITCNYDGVAKSTTRIDDGAFIGSNTALVAPLKIGKGAIVAAGSTISQDVPADAMAIERSSVEVTKGGASTHLQKQRARHAKTKK